MTQRKLPWSARVLPRWRAAARGGFLSSERARRPALGYALAAAGAATAAILRLWFPDLLGDGALLPFVPAVMLASWAGGLKPGLAATVLCAVATIAVPALPQESFQFGLAHASRLGVFVLVAVTISLLSESLHASHRRARVRQRLLEREIAERREVERTLRGQEQSQRRLLDFHEALTANMGEGLYTVDPSGLTTFVNPAAARQLGWASSELLGRRMHDAIHYRYPDGRPFPAEACPGLRVLRDGVQITEQQDTFVRKDGSLLPVIYSSTPLVSEGRILGLVVVFRDVTESKRAAAALQEADRRKDEFLAILAHELRNPLAPIRTALQILEVQGPAKPELVQARQTIRRQLDHLTRLIADLMDLGRITHDRLELVRQPVELSAVLQDALETARPLIEESGHELSLDWTAEPLWLDADRTRLAQLFANLLNNAAKYTPRGGRILLACSREGDQAAVRVRDTGLGIPPDMLERIFDRFAQLDRSIERAQGGLGIGLNLARRLAHLHGGSIRADSAGLGQGSEFCVLLPLAQAPIARAKAPRAAPAAPLPALRKRILVVDDNQDSVSSLKLLLSLAGHEVLIGNDGLAALEAAAEFRPDVALLDIGMPKLNGYEVARRIRSQDWGARVVLVAVTGWGQAEDKRKALEAGFDQHFVKPVDPAVLMKLLAGPLARAAPAGERPAAV